MESSTQTTKRRLLVVAATAGLWCAVSLPAPYTASAQGRGPSLGLPPKSDDSQRQRDDDRKRDDDRRAEDQRKKEESRKQDDSHRQEAERHQQEQTRQEQQRRQQEQTQQETQRRQQEQAQQDSRRSQQEQARQEDQRRRQEQAAQEQRRSEQERARRDAELRQREQTQQGAQRSQQQAQQDSQRRQQEQAQPGSQRPSRERRERLLADDSAATSRRPGLFQTPPPTNQPGTGGNNTPSTQPSTTRGTERAPTDSGRTGVGLTNPRSITAPTPGASPGPASGTSPGSFGGSRLPSTGNSGGVFGRPTPDLSAPSRPAIISPGRIPDASYRDRPKVIDVYGGRGGQPRVPAVVPQVPPEFRSAPPAPGANPPGDATTSERERYAPERQPRRGPSLYQGAPPPPRVEESRRDPRRDRAWGGPRVSDRILERFRGREDLAWRRDRVLPIDRYHTFDHVCDSRCRNGHHYTHVCDGSCVHRRYVNNCPYGPIILPVYVPVPGPTVVYEPPTEVVIVPRAPAPEPIPHAAEPGYGDRLAEPMPLEDVIADIEDAWEKGNLDLLMRHVSPELSVEIYQEGALLYQLNRDQFGLRNEDAFRRYRTLEMHFGQPELLSETEAVAAGTHVFRDDQGEERRVRVIYAFRKQGAAWRLVGVDFTRAAEETGAEPTVAEPTAAQARTEPAPNPEIRGVTLLWSQKLRLSALLAQSRPLRVATLRYQVGEDTATYDLEAMRGIVTNTVAWALYHRGEQTPTETGTVDVARIHPNAWVGLSVLSTASATPALAMDKGQQSSKAALPLHWMASGQVLILNETPAPRPKKPVAPAQKPAPKRSVKRAK